VPPILRSRFALLGLLGIFLIPIGLASLDGLTHVTTCRAGTRAPFTLDVPDRGDPLVTSGATLTPEDANGVCGGLTLNLGVGPDRPGRVRVMLPITNNTRHAWRGSVKLVVGGTSVPVSIGEIDPGETRADSVSVKVGPGSHKIDGTLLIGP
jgi:hypothetical protein